MNEKVRATVRAALIAAVYTSLTLIMQPIAFGPVQLRLSEALCILPVFLPEAAAGLGIGCLLSGVLGGAPWLDFVCGSAVTFLAALLTRRLRNKSRWIAFLPPVLMNAVLTGTVVYLLYFPAGALRYLPLTMLSVGAGELAAVYLAGNGLYLAMKRIGGYSPEERRIARRRETDMDEQKNAFLKGSVFKGLIGFALPVLGALILQAAYGAVDLWVVKQYCSNDCTGAVGTGSNIMHMVTILITALANGATVLIGQHVGERRPDAAGRAVGTSIVLFSAIALLFTAVLEVFAAPFARLMNIREGEALRECVTYVRICAAGIIVITAYNVISGILRGTGNSRLPFLFVGVACVVNIIGDIVLIRYCRMGAAGAAIATVGAQAVSVVISLFVLKRSALPIAFNKDCVRIDKEEMKGIFAIGGPICLEEFMVQISFMLVNGVANDVSVLAPAAYAVAQKLVGFIMLVPSAMSQSVSAFTAQNFGAGQMERARKGLRVGILSGVSLGVFIFLAAFFKGDLMCRIFERGTNEEALSLLELAGDYLKGFAPDCVLTCVMFCCVGYFTGLGKSLPVMLQGITSAALVRIPACLLLSRIPEHTLFYVGLATPITTLYGIAFFEVCLYLHGKKEKRLSA